MKHDVIQCARNYPLAPDVEVRLKTFCALLADRSRVLNLVARGDLPKLWARHVLDSLQLVPLVPPAAECGVDLGSGAGFPGLVLAIATDLPFTLIESHQRKAAFLVEVARLVAAPATVLAARIEDVRLPRVRLVTARALAPLPRLLDLAEPFVSADGVCLFPKGKNAATELTAAARRWHMRVERRQSRTDPAASILRISEIRRARILRTDPGRRSRTDPGP